MAVMSYPDGDRFAVNIADDHQAWLWVISLLSLMYAMVIVAARFTVKWGFLGIDDIAIGAAYMLSIGHWILLYVALQDGLGKAANLISEHANGRLSELVFTSRILMLMAIGLSKCSVLLFIRQIFTKGNIRAWKWCTTGCLIMALWSVVSPVIVSAGCSPSSSVTGKDARCIGNQTRWVIVIVVDILLEVSLVVLPAVLFAPVQMSLGRKVTVVMSFAFRLIIGPLFVAYAVAYFEFTRHGHQNIGIVPTLSWQEGLVCYALISTTIPVLKGFIGRFTTADLIRIDQSGSGIRSTGGAYGQSYALESIKTATHHQGSINLRPDTSKVTTDIYHPQGTRDEDSINSVGSEQMIIHRKVDLRTDTQ